MASAAAVTEDASAEPVNYKTCVLRVSIHCEGCKKKVQKILKRIHGVEDFIIDSKIHKVTVIGNVNGEALIKKLLIKGKHAEFWPAAPTQKVIQNKDKKQETLKNDEIKKDPQPQISKPEQQNQSKPEEEKIQVKINNIAIKGETSNDNGNKSDNEGVQPEKGVNGPTQGAKAEGKLPANSSPVNPTPATDNNMGIENGVAAGTDKAVGSGIIRKKRGKKSQKSTETSETRQIPGDTAGSIGSSSDPASQATESVYRGPSRQHANPYPSNDTPPTYVMSYNTANPRSSYSETYFAQPPTYTYSQTPPPPPYMYAQQPPPAYMYSDSPPRQHPQQQSDSFTMFSDENANGCFIM
ncbi:hypothetical protein MKX01_035803 [Papaver californicum]|nr:hypothetical protein MKX01_035803 [Papaver californicum]